MQLGKCRSVLAGLVVLALLPAGAAQAAEAFKVGVVNQRAVLERTKAGKRELDRLKEFSATRQRIVAADDEELKRLEAEIRNGSLTDEQKTQKTELFRVKLEAYQRRLEEFNREIQAKQQELLDEYSKRISAVTSEIAKKGGYAAVLDSGSNETLRIVLYFSRAIDLTDQVIKEFDRRFP